jgi:DNA-binding response OmpR family regulator
MVSALEGRRVLVADDEPLIAMDLAEELEAAGAFVLGPASTIEDAMALFTSGRVDAAVLDIQLGDELIYPLADRLAVDGVPFVFITGCQTATIPEAYADVPVCDKPFPSNSVAAALTRCSGWRGAGPSS